MTMKRRDALKTLAGAAIFGPGIAHAQSSGKVFRLGTLTPGPPMGEKSPGGLVMLQTLQDRGFTLGNNLSFDARGAGGEVNKLGEIVRAMKADHVDVIIASGFPSALACKVENVPTVVATGAG